jgi:excisionase family DNA binding protein
MDDAYLGTIEAARALGITRQAVLKRIRAGTLEAHRIGHRYVIPIAAIEPVGAAALLARDPALADIVDRLVKGYDPERVYLFGSAARGEAGAGSDYDLMLVMPDDASAERMDARDAYSEYLWGTGAAVDVLIVSRTYFDEAAEHVAASLPATVRREGALLYGAA